MNVKFRNVTRQYLNPRRFTPLLVLAFVLVAGALFLPHIASAAASKSASAKAASGKTASAAVTSSKTSSRKKTSPPVKKRSRRVYVRSLATPEERADLGDRGISSGFGPRAVSRKSARLHKGIDIPAPKDSKILAFNDGVVIFAGRKGGYGIAVVVKQIDGREALYAHMNSTVTSVGDTITRGTHLGYVGRTGRATGYHLHFEITDDDGEHLNPAEHVWHGAELVLGPGDLDPAVEGKTEVASPEITRRGPVY